MGLKVPHAINCFPMLKVAGVGVGVGVGVGDGVGVGAGGIIIEPVEDNMTWVDGAAFAGRAMTVIESIIRIRITIVFFNAFPPCCYWLNHLCCVY